MGITKSKGHKEQNDKFYTNPEISKMCIDMIDISGFDIIIEPSAGNGSFSKQINGCIAYDLVPESEEIIKQDFFELDVDDLIGKNVLTIGNPPFGVQNNLVIKFFNKAAEYSSVIAFILPKSFMKSSVQNKLDLRFHLDKYVELPKNSFLLNGETYDVPCVFQIWKKGNYNRTCVDENRNNPYIKFVKDDFDFAIWRVGGKSGIAYIPENKSLVSSQSNYLVKNISLYDDVTLIKMINEIDKDCVKYCVGPKSISKNELNGYMIEYIGEKRQQSGSDFERVVERLFRNVHREGKKYTDEFDGEIRYDNITIPCQMKHTVLSTKSIVELADFDRNANKQEDYILFMGVNNDNSHNKLRLHYKDLTISIDNNIDSSLSDIFVYHIYPDKLKINNSFIERINKRIINNRYTRCMNIDRYDCNFKDERVFKHGMNTSTKTIMNILIDKYILSRYNVFDKSFLNDDYGYVVYEPVKGFITHIPVDGYGNVYDDVDDVPECYDAILKVDHTNLTDDNWKIVNDFIMDEYNKDNEIISLHIKRDHKNQYRWQCSVKISDIEDVLCNYDEKMFELNGHMKNIVSFDDYVKEPSLWK